MIIIGDGYLLRKAIIFTQKKKIKIDAICTAKKDPFFKKLMVKVFIDKNINKIIPKALKLCKDRLIISTNNYSIIKNKYLIKNYNFFNIHGGLVQNYRGIPEISMLLSKINKDEYYGVTLHKILPCQKVDSGPVISQIKFKIKRKYQFKDIFLKTVELCEKIFEKNLIKLVNNNFKLKKIKAAKVSCSYKNFLSHIKFKNSLIEDKFCTTLFPKFKKFIIKHNKNIN